MCVGNIERGKYQRVLGHEMPEQSGAVKHLRGDRAASVDVPSGLHPKNRHKNNQGMKSMNKHKQRARKQLSVYQTTSS